MGVSARATTLLSRFVVISNLHVVKLGVIATLRGEMNGRHNNSLDVRRKQRLSYRVVF
jgi:hypothetical protein